MFTRSFTRTLVAAAIVLATSTAMAEPLDGSIGSGSGSDWQSSWLDLKATTSFKKGEKLTIKVEGTAENVLIRLLPASSAPSSSDGIEGKSRKVPADRLLQVVLGRDHPSIKQISVHGGPSAWSTPLGANNGTVTIVSIDRVSK